MDGLSIAASLTEIAPRVADSTVRAVYQPERGRFVLHLFSGGHGGAGSAGGDVKLVIDLSETSVRATARETENPATPSTFVMLLRKHLRGGRVVSLSQFGLDRVVALDVTRRDGAEQYSYRLIAELVGTRGNLHLIKDGALVKSLHLDRRNSPERPYVGLPPQEKCDPGTVTPAQLEVWLVTRLPEQVLAERIDGIGRQTAADVVAGVTGDDLALELSMRLRELLTFVRNPQAQVTADGSRAAFYPLPLPASPAASFQEALDRERVLSSQEVPGQDPLLQDLKRAIRIKERTIEKLLDWLENSSHAEVLQLQADLLMTYQFDISRGQDAVILENPADGRHVTVTLDPSMSVVENAQSLYKRAKRIRRGHPHVHNRLARSRQDLSLLQRALQSRERGETVDSKALELLPSRRKQTPPQKKPLPFRQFEVDGYQIWMGKSASQNDALLRAASPNDVWMHAKDYAGSHVVVRSRGHDKIPDAVIRSAARLAALHSKAKSERRVEVTVTQVKKVRKPKGAPAGLVNVRDTDTLTVTLAEGEA